jgi:hypothetical protein
LTLRWQEVAVPLAVVFLLIVLKYVPAVSHLPLGRAAGIVSFSYAIFLALRLIQGEQAVTVEGGWNELRASPVELFGALTSGLLSGLLLSAVIANGSNHMIPSSQLGVAMGLSLAFALAFLAIAALCLFVKVRWTHMVLEHRNAFGKSTRILWADVAGVKSDWRGVTIFSHDNKSVSFSPFHSGVSQLQTFAAERARRNATSAVKAFANG